MALVKKTLIDALFAAETDGIKLTKDAERKVMTKCKSIANAIDDYIKSATITASFITISNSCFKVF